MLRIKIWKLRRLNLTIYICGTLQRVFNKETRKEARINYGYPNVNITFETWTLTKTMGKYRKGRNEIAYECGGYTLKDQIRNTLIRNELNTVA